MKFSSLLFATFLCASRISALAVPDPEADLSLHASEHTQRSPDPLQNPDSLLNKRDPKGGGGGGGGGDGGGRGGGGGGGGGGSRGVGSSSSSGGKGSPRSGRGYSTYANNAYFSGGGKTAYRSGQRSVGSVPMSPNFWAAAAIYWYPGWYYPWGVDVYPWPQTLTFYNPVNKTTETLPVRCACQARHDCGCDVNTDKKFLDDIITVDNLRVNGPIVTITDVKNKSDDFPPIRTLVFNGTLPSGTSGAWSMILGARNSFGGYSTVTVAGLIMAVMCTL